MLPVGEYSYKAYNPLMDLRLALRLFIIGIAITYFLAAIFWYWRMIKPLAVPEAKSDPQT